MLYAFSPFVVSQWLSGHLDVQVAIVLGPAAVWAGLCVLRTGSLRAAIALGLAGSGLFLLTTGQGSYWVLPLVVVLSGQFVVSLRRTRRAIGWAVRGAAVALATFVVASAVELLPLVAGAKAPFLDTSQSFYIEGLQIHVKYSLPFWQSFLGVPREAWLPPGVNLSFAAFDSFAYALFVCLIFVVALRSLLGRHRRLAAALLVVAVVAWLLASGPSGPAGAAYRVLYDSVSYFRLLRVPNRWLMVAEFSVATTFGLACAAFAEARAATRATNGTAPAPSPSAVRRRLGARGLIPAHSRRAAGALAAVAVVAASCGLALAQAGGIVTRGLPTTTAPANLVAAYSSLKSVPGDFRVLTTPFYQAWMGSGPNAPYGNYETILSDLGYISTYWDSRNSFGRGGWDARSAEFGTLLYDLTKQGTNEHLGGLLGAAGIRYLGLDPQPSFEVIADQNPFFAHQAGFAPAVRDGDVAILRNERALPEAFVTPTFCVVAGGLSTLGDLSKDPSFSFARTGLVFADQASTTGGTASLAHLISASHCVIEAPGGARSLEVALHATATAAAASLAPASFARTDVSPLLDVQADPALAVVVPAGGRISWRFSQPAAGAAHVWVRALVGPGQSALALAVDGRAVGRISLDAQATLGYRWIPVSVSQLAAGGHSLSVTALAGTAGSQVVALASTPGAATTWSPTTGTSVVRDVNDLDGSIYQSRNIDVAAPLASTRWFPEQGIYAVSHRPGRLVVSAPRQRTYYTLAEAEVDRPIDPDVPFALRLRGAGSGQTFYLNFYFGGAGDQHASFRIQDTTDDLRTLYFSPQLPPIVSAVPDWGDVVRITLSTNSKAALGRPVSLAGPFAVRTSTSTPHLTGTLPSPGGATGSTDLLGDGPVGTKVTLHHVPAGLLVLTQSYAGAWKLEGATASAHTVALGFANAYLVTAPAASATLAYSQQWLGTLGTVVSLVAWLGGLAAILAWPAVAGRRRRRRRLGPTQAAAGGQPAP